MIKSRFYSVATACIAAILAFNALPSPALADTHYPVIELTPIFGFDAGGTIAPLNGKAGQLSAENGSFDNGSVNVNMAATLPITKAISFTYARVTGVGSPNSYLERVYLPSIKSYIYPGGVRDYFQNYELTEHLKSFTFEEGLSTRTRNCCPNVTDKLTSNSLTDNEWHIGTLGLTYTTPSLSFLNHGVFFFNETLKTQYRNPSPDVLAAEGSLNIASGGARRIYETTQVAGVVVPIDPRHGFTVNAVYIWGPLDFFMTAPYPFYYTYWQLNASKRITKDVDFTLRSENVVQRRNAGTPFGGADQGIHAVAIDALFNFRLDLNSLLHK